MNRVLLLIILFSQSAAQALLFRTLGVYDCHLLDSFAPATSGGSSRIAPTAVELDAAGLHGAVTPKLTRKSYSTIPETDRDLARQLAELYTPNGEVGQVLFAHFSASPAERSKDNKLPFQLAITRRGDNRWSFKLTQVSLVKSKAESELKSKVEINHFDLTPLAIKLDAIHRKNVETRLRRERSSDTTDGEFETELQRQVGPPLDRENPRLLSSIEVPPEQILLETYRFLAAEYRKRELRYGK